MDPVARIHALLDRLVRRERGLLGGVAALRGLAAAGACWFVVAVAVNLGWAHPPYGAWWVATIGVGAIAAAVGPLRAVAAARDRRRQAARVEALRPELRGELLTVLDRSARPAGSPVLLARLAAQVAEGVGSTEPRRVHPARRLRPDALATVLAAAALLLAALAFPTGPVEALERLVGGTLTVATPTPLPDDGPRALVGDIRLRYLYPTYTGLEPLEVPNATGDVHAPPGTRVEVSARTAVPYPAAVLEVYDAAPTPVPVTDGRDLAAAFTVAGPGVWRFRFGELPSPDYQIVPDPDLAPDVSVQVATRSVRAVADQPMPFRWDAKDDYGIERVVVEVKVRGETREVELRVPPDPTRLLGESARVTPRDLGLSPGDKASLRVKAWDNDAISGSKAGWSAAIDVEVLSAEGNATRLLAARRALRDAYVRVLAAFLVEPSPVVRSRAVASAWTTDANARYEEVDAIVASAFAEAGSKADRVAIDEVNQRRQALLSFVRGMAAGTGELATRDLDTERTLQAQHIEAVEGAVLLLDEVLRMGAQQALAKLTQDVASEAAELREDLGALTREEAMARLDQLERLLEQVMATAAQLGEGELKEFLNQRTTEIQGLMDEVRKALAEGRTEDAQALMERLAQQLQEMADGIADQQQRRGESSNALAEAMDALEEEMKALEAEQKGLREETEQAREEFGPDMDAAVEAWKEVERRAEAVARGLDAMKTKGEGSDLPTAARLDLGDRKADADGLLDSARARDLDTALDRARRLEDALLMLDYGLTSAQRRSSDPAVKALAQDLQRQNGSQKQEAAKIRELLEKMEQNQQRTSPALQQALQKLAAQQQQIEERAEQAASRAEKLAPNLPMNAPGLEAGARQGAEQAGRAAQAMEEGDPMGAEGGQRAAEDGFRAAREALDQARQTMQSMQQSAQGQEEGEGQDRGDQRGQDGPDNQTVALPAPEEFQTPEAYREALLEGMSGAVPEEYKSLNRRYYEELVRQ